MQEGWRYYNHALIPTTPPHEKCMPIKNKREFWMGWGGIPLFARWTSDFDCGYETEWWYVIKDEPFDLNAIQSKKRYEINKGNRNFEVKIIRAADYAEELYRITKSAYEQYPLKYRPNLQHDSFINGITGWDQHEVYAAFNRKTGAICGYAWINVYENYVDFCVLKADPEFERDAVNAAIVYAIVSNYSSRLNKNFYICDGARATVHETRFQDYLEKYFGFRKAYCKLNLAYPVLIGALIKVIYPFRNVFNKDGKFGLKVSNVMFYEDIVRSQ